MELLIDKSSVEFTDWVKNTAGAIISVCYKFHCFLPEAILDIPMK